jgi:chromosome segregation ATPase
MNMARSNPTNDQPNHHRSNTMNTTTLKTLESRRAKAMREHQALQDEITRMQLWGDGAKDSNYSRDLKALKASARKVHALIRNLDQDIKSAETGLPVVAANGRVSKPPQAVEPGTRRAAITIIVPFEEMSAVAALLERNGIAFDLEVAVAV